MRDYIHPDDLFNIIEKCLNLKRINAAFDAYSLKPVEKKEILEFFSSQYSLKYKTEKSMNYHTVTGHKSIYYSLYKKAGEIDYQPQFSSMDTIRIEAEYLFQKKTCKSISRQGKR